MKFIQEVCEMFDVEVLCDIEPAEPENEESTKIIQVIALGCRAEMGAGLWGFTMTPWFSTEQELDDFLGLHIDSLRVHAATVEHVPNITDWALV